MRNSLLSKKLKNSETRILIIDDNQIRYNQIIDILSAEKHAVHAILLDDLKNFEKQLNTTWDVIIFGRAYDLKYDQTISLVQNSAEFNVPILLLKPDNYYKEQYQSYINKGIYDIINLEYPDRVYISFIRAFTYSRAMQTQKHLVHELGHIQVQNEERISTERTAIATLEEGIHVHANDEYLQLFGLKTLDELIGLPILDILKPDDIIDFKKRFKKINQGQFELGKFSIQSSHPRIATFNPLKIEFLPSTQEDALQISIVTSTQSNHSQTAHIHSNQHGPLPLSKKLYNALNLAPHKLNAFVLLSIVHYPEELMQHNWQTVKDYFAKAQQYLKQHIQHPLFPIDTLHTGVLVQAQNQEMLYSYLSSLATLDQLHVLEFDEHHFPIKFKLGYQLIDQELLNENNIGSFDIEQFIEQAFNQALPQNSALLSTSLIQHSEDSSDFSSRFNENKVDKLDEKQQQNSHDLPAIEYTPSKTTQVHHSSNEFNQKYTQSPSSAVFPQTDILTTLKQQLSTKQFQLKFQQLYDKQDNFSIYEVNAGFYLEQKWCDLDKIEELRRDPLLSIEIDRWILLEASKQLHNFITQYPKAILLIPLNPEILFNDQQFFNFISQILQNFKHCPEIPLILQIDFIKTKHLLDKLSPSLRALKQLGLKTSMKNIAVNAEFENLLQFLDLDFIKLNAKSSQMLNDEHQQKILQTQVLKILDWKKLSIILSELNDMNLFANAWNIEARYLQGDYFQKKLDHLTDVQDQ